jgi:hypothetical protein
MFNAVIQANLIPNELSNVSAFLFEWPESLGTVDELRFSNFEGILIAFHG